MDDEVTDRQMQFALISQKLKNIKTRFLCEDNTTGELNLTKSSASDHTGNVKQILSSNSPETCFAFLMKMEERGNPNTDSHLLRKLIDLYSQVFASLPIENHCKNESYARILVRFAELKAIQEPDAACDDFYMARVNCKIFAFVHIAHAQYELFQGNLKKSTSILQKAWEMNAKPIELLETAMSNLRSGKTQLLSPEDKENMIVPTYSTQDSKSSKNHDGTGDIQSTSAISQGIDQKSSSPEEIDVGWKVTQIKNSNTMLGRVPMQPLMTPDTSTCLKSGDPSGLRSSMKRQTSGTRANQIFVPSLSKSSQISIAGDGDPFRLSSLKPASNVSPVNSGDQEMSTADSTMTLLNKTVTSVAAKREETRSQVPAPLSSSQVNEQVVSNHSKISSSVGQPCPKPSYMETVSEWKIPARICREISPENKQSPAEQPNPQQIQDRLPASKRGFPGFVYETPNNKMSCVNRTPVVKEPRVVAQISTPYNVRSAYRQPGQNVSSTPYQPSTSFNQGSCSQQFPQVPPSVHSNDCIVIKGKTYYVLKQIGRGGSSKVFQVLDHKKQLFAVKYVDLEDADNQTIESYKNEIEHLNRLQQHSDQIIKLYDYEMTNSYIYMLMECGNLDLNSWLRSKKAVNPLERKFYWKNMLEAVQTIHRHGIIHSDLKPANFVIVNASLKLIDFGIANQIQPDVTSIVKDSQVGTLNYMPPEAIKDDSSFGGKHRSKISPKSDVWSLGCILYCMTYGKTPFQHITNQITKLQAIIDPSYEIEFPDIPEKDLRDVLRRCLVRNPKERVSIDELLGHSYLQMQLQSDPESEQQITSQELMRIFNELASISSPNSISRAANNLAKMCNSGRKLDVSECIKPSSNPTWKM
ncbi:dual specificity protein kinase Ttk isoform X1 [Acipenser oxyrinchus oxyrinchus]|uniref:Dual specificity protein kinase Ttk isoform X1 n=1 Tax=Acipenser oxyrinchus oxyrinchus TaxID=40147 RepID=A0AAD8LQH8_ACIOX|nr:dual specificity protein kinase Ttk isoform X1 [Acipenser oxyrinchus oxyrinchus]